MSRYAVVVGNIGQVYAGGSRRLAFQIYEHCVTMSKDHEGRASGEWVHLFERDEIIREHFGEVEA